MCSETVTITIEKLRKVLLWMMWIINEHESLLINKVSKKQIIPNNIISEKAHVTFINLCFAYLEKIDLLVDF
jgi:hypothetical protein